MFEHISKACGNQLKHKQHSTYEGWFGHRKITCYGKDYDTPSVDHSKTVNQQREEAGLPEIELKPHKHRLYFSGLLWGSKGGSVISDYDQELVFYCRPGCPTRYEVRVNRWTYHEMTRTMPKVDQIWPG